MILLDNSIIFMAIPKIQTAMHLSSAGLAWVQDAYALVFGGLLLLGAGPRCSGCWRRDRRAGVAVDPDRELPGGSRPGKSGRPVRGDGRDRSQPGPLPC
jgi:hypothetical protein